MIAPSPDRPPPSNHARTDTADASEKIELLRLRNDPDPIVRVAALGWCQFLRLVEATHKDAA